MDPYCIIFGQLGRRRASPGHSFSARCATPVRNLARNRTLTTLHQRAPPPRHLRSSPRTPVSCAPPTLLPHVRHEERLRRAGVDDIASVFQHAADEGNVRSLLKLKAFKKFDDLAEALTSATALGEGKLSKTLKKFLRKHVDVSDELAIGEAKLAGIIKEKLELRCVYDPLTLEIMRGVRAHADELLRRAGESSAPDAAQHMTLGLAHSLSRYKLKFSPDKLDVMVVQAISLLDDLDKEINTYAMRLREWFGWHFPELSRLVADNVAYAKVVGRMRTRERAAALDFSDLVDADTDQRVKEMALVSMGTEVGEEDVINMVELAEQVVCLADYRVELFEYLRNRMAAIAPNLTAMVGELVGARLIAHAGSLMNLAKYPASTIQILGAEKALFRALKTKHATPKYGLIYHASLVGQASAKNKGKISRVLAAKAALATRVDALGEHAEADTGEATLGLESRAKV
eukprot:ctg_1033.g443